MKLADWMAANEVSAAEMSRRIGLDHERTLYRYMRGERVPRPEFMIAIVRETAGAVQPNDFFDVPGAIAAASHGASPLTSVLSRLGGHVAVAEGAGIAVTVLEKMETEGRIWPQYRRQIVDLAARRGLLLDPDALTLTAFPEHPGAAA